MSAPLFRPSDLTERPDEGDLWERASGLAAGCEIADPYEITDGRQSWYCPTTTVWDAARLAELLEECGISRVYDLGAGDCRVSLWLAERGYNVVAYEIRETLVQAVRETFDVEGFEVRCADYYEDFEDLIGEESAVVAFGGTNELPHVPDVCLAVEGYGEIGVRAHYAGELVAVW